MWGWVADLSPAMQALLVLAIPLHSIPKGLAIGIGIQNFPEDAAVSLPLRRDGMSRRESFFYGQLSGMVVPVAALLGFTNMKMLEMALG